MIDKDVNIEAKHIIETVAKSYYFHFELDYQHMAEAVVLMEPSMGLLTVVVDGMSCSHAWPDNDQWGTATFEAFLHSRPARWITAKLLGKNAVEIDLDKTQRMLMEAHPGYENQISRVITGLSLHGIDSLDELDQDIVDFEDVLGEPIAEWVCMRPTDLAVFLMNGVIPNLQQRCYTPPKTDPRQLKLC